MLDMSRPLDGLPASPALPASAEPALEPATTPGPATAAATSPRAATDTAGPANARAAAPAAPRPPQPDVAGAGAATTSATTVTDVTGVSPVIDVAAADTAVVSMPIGRTGDVAAAPVLKSASVGTPQPLPDAPGGAGAIGGAVFALLLVVGLILALAWLAKRMPGVAGSSNAALRVVGSLSLGPRERVVVVAVGDTQLLLSVGAGGTRTLHTLESPLAIADAPPSAFATLLSQQFGKKA